MPPFEGIQLHHVLATVDGAWSFGAAASRERELDLGKGSLPGQNQQPKQTL